MQSGTAPWSALAIGPCTTDLARWRPSKTLWACSALALAAVVLVVRTIAADWIAIDDNGSIELRVRAVGGVHTPLVGVYSRYGWNHPGPLLFYALTIPYRLLGSRSSGLLTGALLLNVAACVVVLVYLWRRGGAPMMLLGAAVLAVLLRSIGPTTLVDPWNPFAATLPVLATLVLAWSVACRDWSALVPTVLFASFAAQSHLGTVPVVLVPAITGVVIGVIGEPAARWRRPVLIALGVAIVLWSPLVIDEFRPRGGNFGKVWRFSTHHHARQGLVHGAQLVSGDLSIPAPWITGHTEVNHLLDSVVTRWHVPFALLALAVAVVAVVRFGDRAQRALLGIALAGVVAAWISAAQIVDAPLTYLVRDIWPVAAFAWLATAWVLWSALQPHARARQAFVTIAVVVSISSGAALAVASFGSDMPEARDTRVLQPVRDEILAALRRLPQPIMIRSTSFEAGVLAVGVATQAAHHGITVRFPQSDDFAVGPGYVMPLSHARSTIVLAFGPDVAGLVHEPDVRVLLQHDSLSAATRDALNRAETLQRHPPHGDAAIRQWLIELQRAQAKVSNVVDDRIAIALFLPSS